MYFHDTHDHPSSLAKVRLPRFTISSMLSPVYGFHLFLRLPCIHYGETNAPPCATGPSTFLVRLPLLSIFSDEEPLSPETYLRLVQTPMSLLVTYPPPFHVVIEKHFLCPNSHSHPKTFNLIFLYLFSFKFQFQFLLNSQSS